jgi:hypothetical protein
MSVFQTMMIFHLEALGFYIKSKQGERDQITGETEREHIKVSICTKFKKADQENRAGIFTRQDVCG